MSAWFAKKDRILIFGCGSGGANFYRARRRSYHVLGFVDNNVNKQGQKMFGRPIRSPTDLPQLDFDKIIIASDFYPEIHAQLIGLGIDEKKMEIFSLLDTPGFSLTRYVTTLASRLFHHMLCGRPGYVSDALFLLYKKWGIGRDPSIARMSLHWLDETHDFKIRVLRPRCESNVQGPQLMGGSTPPAPVMLPEVALHRFRRARAGSVSRSVILPGNRIVVERVSTFTPPNADYCAGHLLYHGKQLALVSTADAQPLAAGILITGCSETNYYHWLLEILSQLQFIPELPEDFHSYPLLIPAQSQKIPAIKALLEHFGLPRPVILLETATIYEVDDLLFINSPNNLIPNVKNSTRYYARGNFDRPESIDYLRRMGLMLATELDSSKLPKRVFLARKGFIRRYNQAEIYQALEHYGFTCVYMEEIDIRLQVATIANAEMVVGPTGAAWTNIIFASPGAKGLCWMPEEFGGFSAFSNLAAITGVSLDYITYPTGAMDTRELYYKGYKLDKHEIIRWVRSHLAGDS